MYLREDVDLNAFLEAVRTCRGDVYFRTDDDDSLNLRSFLSCYLFSMVASNRDYILSGQVVCKMPEDYEHLTAFLYQR